MTCSSYTTEGGKSLFAPAVPSGYLSRRRQWSLSQATEDDWEELKHCCALYFCALFWSMKSLNIRNLFNNQSFLRKQPFDFLHLPVRGNLPESNPRGYSPFQSPNLAQSRSEWEKKNVKRAMQASQATVWFHFLVCGWNKTVAIKWWTRFRLMSQTHFLCFDKWAKFCQLKRCPDNI